MRAKVSKKNVISTAQQTYLLSSILQHSQQNFVDIWQTAFGKPSAKKIITAPLKNQQSLYRLKGKGLVLLQTNFCKKPKNPV